MKKNLFLFLSFLFVIQITAQKLPNDCVNALTVCGNGSFESNAVGAGNFPNEIQGCSGKEEESLWLKITIAQSGTLGFDLKPEDPALTVDYDFWVYDKNKKCTSLGSPIRCCTTNPALAGMSNNHTGMNGTSSSTTGGPGANGNGYVRWLNVIKGETYYIAIDRPEGDGGFILEWTGTATSGTGAFSETPTANSIPDYATCSSTPDIGIFDLNSVSSSINPDTSENIITYHETIEDANDNIRALFPIYSNKTNPQTIYARVTDILSGCYNLTEFDLVVNVLPTVSIVVSTNDICSGDNVVVLFNGTPNAVVEYTINNGSVLTTTLNSMGLSVLDEKPSITSTYKIVQVRMIDPSSGNTVCSQIIDDEETVNVNPIPTASISGSTTICSGATANITFVGTPNAVVDYTVDSVNKTISLDALGNAIISTPTLFVDSVYELVKVTTSGATACSQVVSGNATVTVLPLPTATITGTTSVCQNDVSPKITFTGFNGMAPYTFTYKINNGPDLTVNTISGDSVTIDASTTTLGTNTYELVGVQSSSTPSCNQPQSGNAVITVVDLPTASISGTTTICYGTTAEISFIGTPNAIVNYIVDSVNKTVALDVSGKASVFTPILTNNSVYELVKVTSNGTLGCSKLLTGNAIVTVIPLPTATITGTTSVCKDDTNPLITFTGFNGVAPYTFTYKLNNGANQTITTTTGDSATISVSTTSLGTFIYELVSVLSSSTPSCSQPQSGSAEVIVNPPPTATISGTSTICAGTSTVVSFSGTPNSTVSYTVDSIPTTILLDTTGKASINTPLLTKNSTYNLVSVTSSGSAACTQTVSGSATISVKPYATIDATPSTESICSGNSTSIVLTSSNPATTFSWVANASNVNGASDGNGNKINQNLTTITSNSGVVVYNVLAKTNGCDELPIDVTVNVSPKPTAIASPNKNPICSGDTATILLSSDIPNTTFSWTVSQTNATGATSGNGNSINQVLSTTGTIQGTATYTITPNNNGCIGNTTPSIITINPLPIISATSDTSICSGETTNIIISSNLSGTTYSWKATPKGVNGSSNGTGATINQTLTLTSDTNGSVNYSITGSTNGCEVTLPDYIINVNQLPQPILQNGIICVDQSGTPIQTYILDSTLDSKLYTFEWYYSGAIIPGATKSTYEATKIGAYSVIATDKSLGCQSAVVSAVVNESTPGKSMTLSQTAYFSDNASIYVNVEGGNGTYIYQLDNGSFQSSNVFSNVTPGIHKVTVNDTNGCTDLSDTIYIVGYPKFFTPNGDGYNDTWNIVANESISFKSIRIFDRFGKFLYQINQNSAGWDGTYNGNSLSSSDYWFTFDYAIDGVDQIFKAHFTLKR